MDLFCSHSGLDPLWDWNRTWHTSSPDLTQCFQNTVLVWVPCAYLWVCAPLYCLYLRHHDRGYICISRICWAKTVLGFFLAFCGFVESLYLLLERHREIQRHLVFLLSPAMRSLTMVLAVCVIHVERARGCRSSLFLFLFWLLVTVCSLVPLRSKVQLALDEGLSVDAARYLAFFLYVSLQLAQLVLCCFIDPPPETTKPEPDKNSCPVTNASFLSKIFFWWFGGLVVRGYRSSLRVEDLWSLREEDTSERILSTPGAGLELAAAVRHTFITVLHHRRGLRADRTAPRAGLGAGPGAGPGRGPAAVPQEASDAAELWEGLLRALARSFGPCFLSGTLHLILHDIFMFTIPQVLSLLLGFMSEQGAPLWRGYLYAALLFLLSSLQSLCNHQYMYSCSSVGMRVKTAVMGLVMGTLCSLVLTSSARRECTVGEIVNLVSADTQKLMDFVVYFNAVWVAPIEVGLCLFFLWQHLGPAALAGIATVIVIFPLNGLIAKRRSKLQEVQMKFTDGRIKLMNEILSGIKILKLYAWERAFQERVQALRERELHTLRTSQILYSLSIASFSSSSFLMAFSMFGVYVLTDPRNVLDAQKVFVSMALINILKGPLSQLPSAMSTSMQAVVSLRRLGRFLGQDELKADSVVKTPFSPEGDSLTIENGTFSWSHSEKALHASGG
ncbi:hypothetical protein AAFF_G00212530 [Aldrovandia affinis]|uniref:ABC transmembrane type-1 domain-containing protein n=1 Tax=Aldrovandia affinis TaxID=143900 RepID=A0AAD7RGZ8_9TELE|nr:hypothetical protein AAFF_G00212530 [Aldrovandia affinis]